MYVDDIVITSNDEADARAWKVANPFTWGLSFSESRHQLRVNHRVGHQFLSLGEEEKSRPKGLGI